MVSTFTVSFLRKQTTDQTGNEKIFLHYHRFSKEHHIAEKIDEKPHKYLQNSLRKNQIFLNLLKLSQILSRENAEELSCIINCSQKSLNGQGISHRCKNVFWKWSEGYSDPASILAQVAAECWIIINISGFTWAKKLETLFPQKQFWKWSQGFHDPTSILAPVSGFCRTIINNSGIR